MKNGTSLATKFTITLLIILLIGQGLGFILFILSIRNNLLDTLNEKMKRTGSLLAGISIRPILDNDDELLKTYLEEIIKDEDFVSLTVLDKNKNLIGKKTRFFSREFSRINPFFVEPFLKNETPVLLKNEKIGDVIITSSSKRINDEILKRMVFGVIYQGILLVVVIILVSDFFNRNIRRPISDFSVAVNKASTGDLTVTMQPQKNLEIMVLTKGFNSLIARLKNIVRKLYSTTNDVTMAIKQINLIINKITERTYNQVGATEEVISAMEEAENSQREILDNTDNLVGFSQENLSSLIQVKSTTEEINERAKQLSQFSSDVYSTITEISSAAKAIAKSTEELSTSAEEISASIEQISTNIKEVEDGTKESASLAATVREIASVGMIAVADAMEGMEKIIDSVSKTHELVRHLKTKSKDVEKVLTVITDVSKQTNLLSVNAAILAAQAGEHGTGFSVVADEIKTLADKTASSAKEITDIIKAIQKGTTEVTHVTENSNIIVESGNALVVRTGEAFREVINSAQKSSEMANTIQSATEEQVRGIAQIKGAMEMVMLIVEHVTKATHEHEIGSGHLVDVAEKVNEISEVIKRGMQEQTLAIRLLSRNLELTNERIEHIVDATSKHGKTNKEILLAADKIRTICNDTFTIAQEMAASFNTLYQEADALKRDMEGFKLVE